jgi:hypothetical protein
MIEKPELKPQSENQAKPKIDCYCLYEKGQIATLLNVSGKTLKKMLIKAGVTPSRDRILTPGQTNQLLKYIGHPDAINVPETP